MTPDLPLIGLGHAAAATAGLAASYLLIGALHDHRRWRRTRILGRVQADLAVVLFHGEDAAAAAGGRLADAPRRLVLDMVQRLAADLDGDADDRLRKLVGTAGLHRPIRRRLRSRAWRRRAQTAALAALLPAGDPLRLRLLTDPHPVVRARAAEGLETTDVVDHVDELTELLDDDVEAVRFAAQQALLRVDARAVPALDRYLRTGTGAGVGWALEVAVNLPDPRLIPALELHARADDDRRRAIAIQALAPWLTDMRVLVDGFSDPSPLVRATAAEAAGMIRAEQLGARVGRLLSDESWAVRQQAGRALLAMGPTGSMILRRHLDDADPYARDMARQVLDTMEARHRAIAPASTGGS